MTPTLTLYLLACARDREPTAGWALVDGVVTDGEGSTLIAELGPPIPMIGSRYHVTQRRGDSERTATAATVEDCLGALWGW